MTKSDIDPITDLTSEERSEIQCGLDARATIVMRSMSVNAGQFGLTSEAVQTGERVLARISNAYRKVVGGDGDAFERWVDSFRQSDATRIREALAKNPE